MNKTALTIHLSLVFVIISFSFMLFPMNVIATTSGLKVIVHVNDSGSVCVSSFSEDLGCQYVHGPNQATFEFSPGMVDVNEEFKVCMDNNCKIAINGPEKAPVDVYINTPIKVDEAKPNEATHIHHDNENSQNYVTIFLTVSGFAFILVVMLRRKNDNKRQGFPSYVKKEVLKKQGYKCANCKRSAGVWDFDHADDDRTNNDMRNCQALCPNCHAKKTRGLITYNKTKTPFRKIAYVIVILLFFFVIYLVTSVK